MSYQTELSVLAVKTANSSFTAIAELSKIIACYGDKKEVKICWLECCENNGLVRATASDYWTLAMFFKGIFASYQDAKNAGIKAIVVRFESIGITSIKTAKSYKIAFSKVIAFSDSLKGYRTLEDNDVLESLIESCSISFKTTLENLLTIISSIESFMTSVADTVADTVADFALARAEILANLTTSELLEVISTQDNDSLQAILKGVQAMIKTRNKKAA